MYDIVSISEESPGIRDEQVLSRARLEQRVILTFDRDYGEMIYRLRLAAAPVIYLGDDPVSPQEPAHPVLRLLQISGLDISNRFTVADRDRIHQRPLA